MIDENRTLEIYGYTSDRLSYGSGKLVVAVCEDCGRYRDVVFGHCSELCNPCSKKGRHVSRETRKKQSAAHLGRHPSEETKKKQSEVQSRRLRSEAQHSKHHRMRGKHHSEEAKRKIGEGNKGRRRSEESRIRMSAAKQRISYDEWESYACDSPYCPRFNEMCKESNREKYGRRCFICGLPESENITSAGKQKKLAVHHVDMNKNQGCDGTKWKLVPVCLKHHNHSKLWQARIVYLLNDLWS